ncbi:MAG TPA: hypothetical protein VFA39_01645 [Steroidobacteraceae bacterium]|jgi:hypothetical protein|nr:hypothetical protein [Steroidobacteraceae bacterium]
MYNTTRAIPPAQVPGLRRAISQFIFPGETMANAGKSSGLYKRVFS